VHELPIFGTFVKKDMGKNTSISLGDHFEDFILSKIGSGRYQSASEVIRAGLRLLEQEEQKIEALKIALETGENSGVIQDFNPPNHLHDLHEKHL
jgi:antitoxin ParD1/3/4